MSITRDYIISVNANDSTNNYMAWKRSTATSWNRNSTYSLVNFVQGNPFEVSGSNSSYDEINTNITPYVYYADIPRDISGYDDSTTSLDRDTILEILAKTDIGIIWGTEQTVGYESTFSFYAEHTYNTDYARIYLVKGVFINTVFRTNTFNRALTYCSIKNVAYSFDDSTYYYMAYSAKFPCSPYLRFILTPNSGYKFDDTSINDFSLSSGFSALYTFYSSRVNSDGELLVFYKLIPYFEPSYETIVNSKLYDLGATTRITAKAKEDTTTTYTITSQLENCTASGIPSTATSEDTLNITITANDGYYFATTPYLTYYNTDGNTQTVTFTLASDAKSATATIVLADLPLSETNTTMTVTANAIAETVITTFTVTSQLENCTSTEIPSTVTSEDTLNITITANDGYYFSSAPYILYFDKNANQKKYNFTIASDTKSANVNVAISDLNLGTTSSTLTIKASATPETVYKDDYGSIYVYHVSVANLQDFATKRFFTSTDSSGNITSVDLGDFVAKLHRIYCDIGQEDSDTLKLGNYNTEISVTVPYTDIQTIDCGTVEITGSNNSATDYLGNVKIFLPFIGFESLDADLTVNHTLGLIYKINIITGDLIAELTIDGIVTNVFDGKGARDIYYLTRNEDKAKGAISFESAFMYGFTPYILHTYFTDYNNSISTADSVRKTVNTLTGFFKMNELTEFSNTEKYMTQEEHEKIIELLESGVYYE